jgi:hypothetical protein
MVRAGAFELHVLVGGVKQAELVTPDGKAYVESLFSVPGVSYKVASHETDPYVKALQRPAAAASKAAASKVAACACPRCGLQLRCSDPECDWTGCDAAAAAALEV